MVKKPLSAGRYGKSIAQRERGKDKIGWSGRMWILLGINRQSPEVVSKSFGKSEIALARPAASVRDQTKDDRMRDDGSLFKSQVLLLSQTFFIKDNRNELLLCAHKYDFDILFFDQMPDFVMAVQVDEGDSLFVIDLDVLYNMQDDMQHSRKQTMFLSDLLQRLPPGRSYVYLQTARQSERFLLQQKLVESNCLAYAEKPIANDVLVDKLFTLFGRHKGETNTVVYLGDKPAFDAEEFAAHSIELIEHDDLQTLHLRVRELQPDIVVIEEGQYLRTEAIVRVLQKNIEADPSREIIMLQHEVDAILTREAFDSGFDDVLLDVDTDLVTRQLVNRIDKIRVNKDLISRDRATGLLNKIGLQKRAQEAIRRAGREGKGLAYGIVDIDKFKTINDTWGHYFGDIVIKRLSLVLSAQLGPKDLLSRFGGEEFVLVFWDCSAEEGQRKLDAMRQAFCAVAFEVKPGEKKQFSFSGGIASYPDQKTENELFLHADEMLYHAKEGGRNRICR
jgi:diguanylate cyclase (GGDEF)-like protein